jgi:drug/metabolite transporter (DMT)-like permease
VPPQPPDGAARGSAASIGAMQAPMTPRVWGMLVLLSVVWGASFYLAAVALTGFPPLTIVFGRVAIAALVLVLLCRALGLALPRGQAAWFAVAGMGLLNNAVPFTLIIAGQQFIPSGLAAVVNAATPVFAVLAAHALARDEPATAAKLAGAATGLLGVAILAGPAAFQTVMADGGAAELLGILLCLGACLSYGLSGVWSRRIARVGLAPIPTAAGQCIASSLIVLPLAVLWDQPWTLPAPPIEAVLAVIAFGLFPTALAYVLFYWILARAGATNTMLVTLLVPVTALLVGTLVLDETLAPRHFAGMAVIALGLLVMDGRILARFRAS